MRRLPGGGSVVPGNHSDLLAGRRPATPPMVSVVIPYYDGQHLLDLLLTALTLQTHPPDRLEVIVADDGSPTPPDVGALDGRLPVTVVGQDNLGVRPAAARNLGAHAATGDVLVFLDGDTVPTPGYVEAISRLPALLPDALVSGHRRHAALTPMSVGLLRAWLTAATPGPTEIPGPQWLADLYRRTGGLVAADRRTYEGVISAVLACATSLFDEIGGFDSSIDVYGGEDWELAYRALNAGGVLAHAPHAHAWHDGPDWSGRQAGPDGEAKARRQKAAETAMLAQRIPGIEPGGGPADVVLLIEQPGQGYPPDWAVRTTAPSGWDDELSRARVQITVTGGASPGVDVLTALAGRVGPGRPGRSTLTGPGWTAVAEATAALRRSERWATDLPSPDLLADLFGAELRHL
ncbi:MAG: glycosyltransferase [Geodermatophilaceae bacterium]|nr:glycosyltransferase [Geodermatophilaceae bacterium]